MKYILFVLMLLTSIYGEPASKDDIKLLIGQMDKRFEQIDKKLEQIDRRFEQIDKKLEQNSVKIEQIGKRLDFMQNLIYIILGAVIGLPLYLDARREKHNRDVHDKVKDIIVALRELAQDDPKISRSLKVAGII